MFDIWGFLLQTLTASGVAILLLLIKALFKDKLPPKWHFAIWGVLGMIILIPAGWNGRYTLIHWQIVVEVIKNGVGEFDFTRVRFPFPVISSVPNTIIEWIFVVYVVGVIIHLVFYAVSYIRLRMALSNGFIASDDTIKQVEKIASQLHVKPCRVITVTGLPSAFVYGIIHPVLVVPTWEKLDDKVILHELMHLRSKDTVWSVLICVLRSLHWCNPLIVYCASCATNDMEKRCDQFVLEQLKGEERREYGNILLSMVNERFAKTPGTTCVNNGGKSIRDRIETLARFKKYPSGMRLVSICAWLFLAISLVTGVQISGYAVSDYKEPAVMFASARSTPCTTYAGAFDTYGKAVLDLNGYYRVMCAPCSMQEELYKEIMEKNEKGIFPEWDSGIQAWPNSKESYYVYNLQQINQNTYEGLMVFQLNYPSDGKPGEENMAYLAVQNLRVEKEHDRWVAIPLEEFRSVEVLEQNHEWGCKELPYILYTGVMDDFQMEVKVQTVCTVDSFLQTENQIFQFGNNSFYDTTPIQNAEFTYTVRTQSGGVTHLGTQEERDLIESIGSSLAAVYQGEKRPTKLVAPEAYGFDDGNYAGESLGNYQTEPGWGPYIQLSGGGGTFDLKQSGSIPEYYVADLYINGKLQNQLELYPKKEVTE